jgi:YaiO family outer membrane protein
MHPTYMPADYQQPPTDVQPAVPSSSFDEQYKQARDLANSGQPALALAAYNALLARSPGNADVLLGRGIVLTRMERWDEAEADLTAAAKASPAYADVWSALGNLYRWSGRPQQALDAYARARSLGAGAGEVDAMLAAMRPRPGTPDAAIAGGYTWAAGLSSTWTRLGDNPRWNEQTASVRYYGKLGSKHGSIAFETLRAERFAQTGHAWALDAYADLWSGAYANVRYQRAPAARLFPANAGRIELYQAVGDGWEVSLSDDVLGFGERVNIYGVGLAKYTGNWYVQLRHQNIVSAGAHSSGDRLLGRYYYQGGADSYLELAMNRGRSDDPLSLASGRTRSGGGGVNLVHYFSRDWGGRVGAAFSRDGSGGARERSLSFAVYRRW